MRQSSQINLEYWDWMSSAGPEELTWIDARMYAILEQVLLPSVRIVYAAPHRFTLAQDNSAVHSARVVQDWQLMDNTNTNMRQNQTAFHSSSRGCFRCGEVGHFKRDCKRNYSSESRGHSQTAYQEKPNNYEQGKRHFQQNRGTRRSRGNYNNNRGQFYRSNYVDRDENKNVEVNSDSEDKSVCFMGQVIDDKYKEIETNDKVTFFVDSGCTDHMVNKKQYVSDLVMLKNPIRVAVAKDKEFVLAVAIGNIKLEMSNMKVIFENGFVKLFDKNMKLIAIGERNNLYELSFDIQNLQCLNVENINNDLMKWHKSLPDVTPAEKWFGSKPNVKNLRVFGCLAYNHIPKELGGEKFDPKVEKCIMLGYASTGYRLWNIEKQMVIISKNVQFDENNFWHRKKMGMIIDDDEDLNKKDKIGNVKQNGDTRSKNSDDQDEIENIIEDIRIDKRPIKTPIKYDDYELYMAFDAVSYVEDIPQNHDEISNRKDKENWIEAMNREIAAIEENQTWEMIKTPNDVEILDTKWCLVQTTLFNMNNIHHVAEKSPDDVQPILDWFEDHYVGRLNRRGNGRRQPLFPHEMWNFYNRTLTQQDRTNNHAEAAHRLQRELGMDHPTIWKLIDGLRKVQTNLLCT
ncbi:Zinc knuckle [Popillia japonica]|uniref:Zinc knuckle n=1 Tax=Popillia japonica TaxID=7064 RepID=A0AAW1JF14_POPJA